MSAQFSFLEMNVAMSIFPFGGMLGVIPAGVLADSVGRYQEMEITEGRAERKRSRDRGRG